MIIEGCQCHITVYSVTLSLLWIFPDIAVEYGRVIVKVECQLCIVEIRVLLNFSIITSLGSILEDRVRSHLVLGLDVAVSHLIVGNLAQ